MKWYDLLYILVKKQKKKKEKKESGAGKVANQQRHKERGHMLSVWKWNCVSVCGQHD